MTVENGQIAQQAGNAQMYLVKYQTMGMTASQRGYVMKYLNKSRNQQELAAAIDELGAYSAAAAKRLS